MADTPKKPDGWSPRLWEGLDYFAWLRLMTRSRWAVEPPYWWIAAVMSCVTFGNTGLRWLQHARYWREIEDAPVPPDPVFVLGHWRTGTTLLHELLILDERFTSPTTVDCFMPCHALLTRDFLRRYMGWAVPGKRPMDNMAAGWDRPQEDEFALALLGEPSTYTDIAFPSRPPLDPGALDLSGLTRQQLAGWKRTLKRFVRTVAARDPRRLVLKSPPHTARVPALLELFPDARFVHVTRDPYTLFASTVNLWTSMAKKHGLQTPRGGPALDEKVFREFRVIYDRLEEAKRLVPAGRFHELRYEDLVRDLVGGMRGVYEALGLGGFDAVRPRLEAYAAGAKDYETNKYQLTAEQRARITERWGDVIRRLGYG